MSDIKKKIGKSSLKGLLNVEEKKPEPKRSSYSVGNRYGSSYSGGSSLWDDDDDWHSPTQDFYAASRESTPSAKRPNRPIDYYEDRGVAFVGESEIRRIKVELAQQIESALRFRQLDLSITGTSLLHSMIEELLWSECKVKDVRKPGGKGLYPMVDDVTGDNPYVEVDDDDTSD